MLLSSKALFIPLILASCTSASSAFAQSGGSGSFVLDVSAPSDGTITISPELESYPPGTVVTLTWAPVAGEESCYAFTGWSGDVTSSDLSVSVTMDADKTVTASVDHPEFSLALTPPVGGSLETYPSSATGRFPKCTTVSIKATPAVDDGSFELDAWTGDLAGSAGNPIQIVLNADTSGGVSFKEAWYTVYPASNVQNGSFTTVPALSASGTLLRGGSVVRVTPTPDAGYITDAAYASWDGPFTVFTGVPEFYDYRTDFDVVVNHDAMTVGAYFAPASVEAGVDVTHDVVFAQPSNKPLKYDVYRPSTGRRNLPVVFIIHGGGWRANNEDIMRGLGRELAKTGRYVAVALDYRWAGVADGALPPVTTAEIIEDVYGGMYHFLRRARTYGASPRKILVTGDSAGGHLAASVMAFADKIGTGGFVEGVWEFAPTNVPRGGVAWLKRILLSSIKGVEPSYGVFANVADNDPEHDWSAYVSPQSHIADIAHRALPPVHLTRGSVDMLITPAMVQGYADALNAAGHYAFVDTLQGANHAYLDWKPHDGTIATFDTLGMTGIGWMIDFFDDCLGGN